MYQAKPALLPFCPPIVPMSDEEFVSRISEFTCIQYTSLNGLSGGSCAYQLIASESPERKEQLLSFLKEHPIENLLHGDIIGDGCDFDDWNIRFIFEDRNLNRCIRGYGITETSAPYLSIIRATLIYMPNDEQLFRDKVSKYDLLMLENELKHSSHLADQHQINAEDAKKDIK